MKIQCSKCNKIFNDQNIILLGTGEENRAGQKVFMTYICKFCFKKYKQAKKEQKNEHP